MANLNLFLSVCRLLRLNRRYYCQRNHSPVAARRVYLLGMYLEVQHDFLGPCCRGQYHHGPCHRDILAHRRGSYEDITRVYVTSSTALEPGRGDENRTMQAVGFHRHRHRARHLMNTGEECGGPEVKFIRRSRYADERRGWLGAGTSCQSQQCHQ